MGLLGFFGYLFIGLSPLLAVSVLVIGRKSFLIVLSVISSSWFLLSILGERDVFVGSLLVIDAKLGYASCMDTSRSGFTSQQCMPIIQLHPRVCFCAASPIASRKNLNFHRILQFPPRSCEEVRHSEMKQASTWRAQLLESSFKNWRGSGHGTVPIAWWVLALRSL